MGRSRRRVPSTTWMLATALATVGVVLLGFGGEAASSAGGGGTDPIGLLAQRGRGRDLRRDRQHPAATARRGVGSVHGGRAQWVRAPRCSRLSCCRSSTSAWLTTPPGLVMALWLGSGDDLDRLRDVHVGPGRTHGRDGRDPDARRAAHRQHPGHRRAGRAALCARDHRSHVLAGGLALLAWGSRATPPFAARLTARGGGVSMPHIEIRVDDLSGDAVRALIATHLDGMHDTSPPESVHALDIDGLRHPSITFWSALIDGELAGMGALKTHRRRAGRAQVDACGRPVPRERRRPGDPAAHHRRRHASAGMTSLWLETGSTGDFVPAVAPLRERGVHGLRPVRGLHRRPVLGVHDPQRSEPSGSGGDDQRHRERGRRPRPAR